jgi:hypothetical protein
VLTQQAELGLPAEEMHAWFVQLRQQRGLLMRAVDALGSVPAAGTARTRWRRRHVCGARADEACLGVIYKDALLSMHSIREVIF